MISKIFITGIVVFWLVMTTLMVKRIHFPTSIPKTPVPEQLVMDTFFGQERPGGEFDLLQGGIKVGIVNIIPREKKFGNGETVREIVLWNGGSESSVRWNAIATISKDSTTLQGLDLKAGFAGTDLEFEINAHPDQEAIDYVVRNGSHIIADSKTGIGVNPLQEQTARALLSSWGFGGKAQGTDEAVGEIKTFEQTLEINGRTREVYTLSASMGGGREITAHFNRSGELLLITTFFDFVLRPAAIILDS